MKFQQTNAMEAGAAAAPPRFVRRIVADDRERQSGVPEALANNPSVELTIRRLKLGDYHIDKTLIVERKTFLDFAFSVRDGRLFSQVARLLGPRCERSCLVLEGRSQQGCGLPISRESFQGALIAVSLVFGLPVLRSRSPEETADLIVLTTNQLLRREVRPPTRRGGRFCGIRRHQLFLLQAIPDVGGHRALNLLNHFGSPTRIADASIEALLGVDGIGEVTARRIHTVFHSMGQQR